MWLVMGIEVSSSPLLAGSMLCGHVVDLSIQSVYGSPLIGKMALRVKETAKVLESQGNISPRVTIRVISLGGLAIWLFGGRIRERGAECRGAYHV